MMKKAFVLVLALFFFGVVHSFGEESQAVQSWNRELFGKGLVNAQGVAVDASVTEGKIIGLYYSAHWCPPCRAFTPELVKFYNALKAQNKPFEIVFVTFDRDEEGMKKYIADTKMPWLAVGYQSPQKSGLIKKFDVHQIPTLIILNKDGKVITRNGRQDVTEKGVGAFEVWK